MKLNELIEQKSKSLEDYNALKKSIKSNQEILKKGLDVDDEFITKSKELQNNIISKKKTIDELDSKIKSLTSIQDQSFTEFDNKENQVSVAPKTVTKNMNFTGEVKKMNKSTRINLMKSFGENYNGRDTFDMEKALSNSLSKSSVQKDLSITNEELMPSSAIDSIISSYDFANPIAKDLLSNAVATDTIKYAITDSPLTRGWSDDQPADVIRQKVFDSGRVKIEKKEVYYLYQARKFSHSARNQYTNASLNDNSLREAAEKIMYDLVQFILVGDGRKDNDESKVSEDSILPVVHSKSVDDKDSKKVVTDLRKDNLVTDDEPIYMKIRKALATVKGDNSEKYVVVSDKVNIELAGATDKNGVPAFPIYGSMKDNFGVKGVLNYDYIDDYGYDFIIINLNRSLTGVNTHNIESTSQFKIEINADLILLEQGIAFALTQPFAGAFLSTNSGSATGTSSTDTNGEG